MESKAYLWGHLPDGRAITAFTITLDTGFSATFLDFGATLVSVRCPSAKGGKAEELVMGWKPSAYSGTTVGRYANRIAKGKCMVEGKELTLATNNGPNHLHGGGKGFDRAFWGGSLFEGKAGPSVAFNLTSKDGEEGYPGDLKVEVVYTVTADHSIIMETTARVTGAATVANICNHAYWNLSGDFKAGIKEQELQLACNRYLPVDSTLIPTGELAAVAGTPFDFTSSSKPIGRDLLSVDGGGEPGYDHCFVREDVGEHLSSSASAAAASAAAITAASSGTGEGSSSSSSAGAAALSLPSKFPLKRIALLRDAASGRSMEVLTTQPGVQVYTGNFLPKTAEAAVAEVERDAAYKLAEGEKMPDPALHLQHSAVCLETENLPDAPNKPHFPSPVLRPGEVYSHTTVHRFKW